MIIVSNVGNKHFMAKNRKLGLYFCKNYVKIKIHMCHF